jgi:hypothetical protein
MNKTLFLGLGVLLLSPFCRAQVTCYPESDATANDFWTDHFYYSTCTDYIGSGSKLFEDGSEGYVDFNGGSSVDFTKIHVPNDAEYTVTIKYGIGWCDDLGATLTLNVNGEFVDQLILFRGDGEKPWTHEFDVELYSDYDNVIQLQQVKDWPILLGIQLTKKNGSNISTIEAANYTLSANKGKVVVGNLTGRNRIQIYSFEGKLIHNAFVESGSVEFPVQISGFYVVNVNGTAKKILVK